MTGFLLDTTCIVAAISRTHQHHPASIGEVNRRLGANDRMVLAGHSLAEAYSVVTRLPVGLRIPARAAHEAIKRSFIDRAAAVVSLAPEEYLALLSSLPGRGITGGRVYDTLIAECARKASVDELLTFNYRHFEGLIPGLKVVVPSP